MRRPQPQDSGGPAQHPGSPPRAVLEGSLERVTYANTENGWSVVRVAVPGRREPITAVGNLLGAQPGEFLRLSGRWIHDRKYGEQFRVESYLTVQPATAAGIEKYLGSGLIRGIGPAIAARLVQRFGLETLEVIDAAPARLREVEGIGPKRSGQIVAAWEEQREIRQVMVFLQANGVAATHAVKVYKAYGAQAVAIVRENPYRLAIDIYGIGFKTADRIAQSLGIPADSPRRAEAGLLHALGKFAEEGHVFAPRAALVKSAGELLAIDPPGIQRAVSEMAAADQVVVEPAGEIGSSTDDTPLLAGPSASPPQPPGVEGEDDAIYLKSMYQAEVGVASLVRALLAAPARPIEIDVERAIAWFEAQKQLTLAPEQREAIRQAVSAKVLVITGGPGTGKTTLLNGILSILEKKGRRIQLAAPTGRAAKRMAEATGRPAETLHRLLEFSPQTRSFQRDRQRPLETDLLVVDETSMLDTVLALSVLKAVPPRAQLLLVGDVDQLPSVGPGRVLAELIVSGAVPVVRLRHIFRQAQTSLIVTNAHRIHQGRMPVLPAPESMDSRGDFLFVEKEEPEALVTEIKALVGQQLPQRFGLHPIDDIQVLVPMNRGTIGAAQLNAELQAHLNPGGDPLVRGSRAFRVGDKVMQIRNNYDLEVFNGDLGRIQSIDRINQRLSVLVDRREVTYDFADLDELVLAYATTVHKAQGSEYPCVVLPLHTQHYALLQRNLLYTAVTRGRQRVVLVGSRRALAIAVRNGTSRDRYTRLAARLEHRTD